jgi:hypothetical protein
MTRRRRITVVLNNTPKYASTDVQPILDAIVAQFETLNIIQVPLVSYCNADDLASDGPASAPPASAPSPPASG